MHHLYLLLERFLLSCPVASVFLSCDPVFDSGPEYPFFYALTACLLTFFPHHFLSYLVWAPCFPFPFSFIILSGCDFHLLSLFPFSLFLVLACYPRGFMKPQHPLFLPLRFPFSLLRHYHWFRDSCCSILVLAYVHRVEITFFAEFPPSVLSNVNQYQYIVI